MGSGPETTTNTALSGLVLAPWSERDRTIEEIVPVVQGLANSIAGLQSAAFTLPAMPGAGAGLPVQFVVGSTLPQLASYELGQQLVQEAYASGLFVYADLDVKYDRPEVRYRIDREKAGNLGVNMEQVGQDLGVMLSDQYVNRFDLAGSQLQSYSPGCTPLPIKSRAGGYVSGAHRQWRYGAAWRVLSILSGRWNPRSSNVSSSRTRLHCRLCRRLALLMGAALGFLQDTKERLAGGGFHDRLCRPLAPVYAGGQYADSDLLLFARCDLPRAIGAV